MRLGKALATGIAEEEPRSSRGGQSSQSTWSRSPNAAVAAEEPTPEVPAVR